VSFDDETDGEVDVRSLNRVAVAGLIGSFFLALAGLFVLPAADAVGLSTRNGFWIVLAVEFVGAVGVGVSARRLYD
jgi:hypothetical protein